MFNLLKREQREQFMLSVPPTLPHTHHFSQGDDRRKSAFTDQPMAPGSQT